MVWKEKGREIDCRVPQGASKARMTLLPHLDLRGCMGKLTAALEGTERSRGTGMGVGRCRGRKLKRACRGFEEPAHFW